MPLNKKGPIIGPPAKRHFIDGSALNAGLIALWLSGDPDKYYKETLYFYDFSGGPDPLPPSGSAQGKYVQIMCLGPRKARSW